MLSSVAISAACSRDTPAAKAATLAPQRHLTEERQAAAGPDHAPENVLLAYQAQRAAAITRRHHPSDKSPNSDHPPHGSSVAGVPSARKITGVRPCTRHTDDRDVSRENKDGRPRRELIRRRYTQEDSLAFPPRCQGYTGRNPCINAVVMTNLLILLGSEHHVTGSGYDRWPDGEHRCHVGRMLGSQHARVVTDQATEAELAIRIRPIWCGGSHP